MGSKSPGNSPGLTTIYGDYSQDAGSTLFVEIAGLLAGTEYDLLDVTGTAFLDGTLDVDFYDLGGGLFEPELGDSFDIITAETISGSFDILFLASLGSGLGWELSYLVDAIGSIDVLRLSVVNTVPVPAAIWLFASGLLVLAGVTGSKRARSVKS